MIMPSIKTDLFLIFLLKKKFIIPIIINNGKKLTNEDKERLNILQQQNQEL